MDDDEVRGSCAVRTRSSGLQSWVICLILLGAISPVELRAQPSSNNVSPGSTSQEPATEPVVTQPTGSRRLLLRSLLGEERNAQTRERLVSAPDMFGDYLPPPATFRYFPISNPQSDIVLPQAGGGTLKIGENGEVLPVDRVFFNYNHYSDALSVGLRSGDINRYTFGYEQTFFEGLCSVEFRLPMYGEIELSDNTAIPPQEINAGNFGNISLILKSLLYADEQIAIACGLGIETPTAEDSRYLNPIENITIDNEVFHLHPYLGMLYAAPEGFFCSSFLQTDFGMGGNRLTSESFGASTALGEYNTPNIFIFDVAFGYWLFQNPDSRGIVGFAPMCEFHYTKTLDPLPQINVNTAQGQLFSIGDPDFQMLNMTLGLNCQLANGSSLRVGTSLPLSSQQTFDNEFLFQYTMSR